MFTLPTPFLGTGLGSRDLLGAYLATARPLVADPTLDPLAQKIKIAHKAGKREIGYQQDRACQDGSKYDRGTDTADEMRDALGDGRADDGSGRLAKQKYRHTRK